MAGRPMNWESPEEMDEAIQEYLDSKDYLTVTGLAIHLGFASRQSIYDYLKNKPQFSYVLTRALLHVENSYERGLYGKSSNGCQFALQNMGWATKAKTENRNFTSISELSDEELDKEIEELS